MTPSLSPNLMSQKQSRTAFILVNFGKCGLASSLGSFQELQGVAAMIVESDSKDCVDALVPFGKQDPWRIRGFFAMAAYHLCLLYRIMKHPNKTVIGINTVHLRFWVSAMMGTLVSYGVRAVLVSHTR
uniref:Uncharacterized protein n=1 Tax=Quercus lobata TaxID=97700 RepID=A0A7N2MIQ7_QUELO